MIPILARHANKKINKQETETKSGFHKWLKLVTEQRYKKENDSEKIQNKKKTCTQNQYPEYTYQNKL